jgi:hypothetical protein
MKRRRRRKEVTLSERRLSVTAVSTASAAQVASVASVASASRALKQTPYGMIYLTWGVLLFITLCIGIYAGSSAENRVVYDQTHQLQPLATSSATHVVYSDPIELKSRQNLQISVFAPLNNSWAWVGGNLINEETGAVESFELPVEFYYGVEDREQWVEGSKDRDIFISSLPKGKYTLRLEFQWERFDSPMPITVTVKQGVARTMHLGLVLIIISIIPTFLFMRQREWLTID